MRSRQIRLVVIWLALAARPTVGCVDSGAASQGSVPAGPEVVIESLELTLEESFPIAVSATLVGRLRVDRCAVEMVEQRFEPEERAYRLELTATAAPERECRSEGGRFEIGVPLVKAGLAAGTFGVTAGEHRRSFEIEPLGEFPGIDLPSRRVTVWVCSVVPRVCFSPPSGWERRGSEWLSPPHLAARMGIRWREAAGAEEPMPRSESAALVRRTRARVSWGPGWRVVARATDAAGGEVWSERLQAPCGARVCELWLEAPSEPLLEAAGEDFAQTVRFAVAY